jgi:competence protein ComEC
VPRSCWLALGGAAAALSLDAAGPLAFIVSLVVAGAWAARNTGPERRLLVAILVGALLVAGRLALGALLSPAEPAASLPAGSGPWVGTVVALGTPSGGYQRATLVLDGDVPAAGRGEAAVSCRLPRYPSILPGDRVRVEGTLRPPSDDGYGAYLRRTGVAATLASWSLERLGRSEGPGVELERLRRSWGDLLAHVLPVPQAGLAAGILVGLRDEVDRDLAAAFTTAGLSHVVAISGWNIALVAAALAALLGRLSRRWRSILTLAAIVAYTMAAGAGASVVRAAIMAAAVLLARETGRRGRAVEALGLAALAMLVVQPAVVHDAGFQLSVIATAGLLAWGTPLAAVLRARLPGRVPSGLVEALGVSLAAQAATLPLVLVDFGRLSLVAPLANLAAAPLVAPVMPCSGLALVAGGAVSAGAPSLLGSLAGAFGGLVIGALVSVVRISAALPGASLTLDPVVAWILATAAVLGTLALGSAKGRQGARSAAGRIAHVRPRIAAARSGADGRPSRGGRSVGAEPHDWSRTDRHSGSRLMLPSGLGRHRGRLPSLSRVAGFALATAVVSLVVVVSMAAARPDGRFHVDVLDVGQGDAIYVQGPDAGGRRAGPRVSAEGAGPARPGLGSPHRPRRSDASARGPRRRPGRSARSISCRPHR